MADEITLVDAHVHVHPGTDVSSLLDAAAANLATVAARLGAQRAHYVLMLAEMHSADWFEAIRQSATQLGRWLLEPVPDDAASLVAKAPGAQLTIIAGRQIVTAEGIEVLALTTRAKMKDGMPLEETISTAAGHDALVVLPWGAGKWLGARGRLVAAAVATQRHRLFVGDNGGRPRFWPEPAVFATAKGKGRPILPGTDPLPLPREERRVGSFGFWLKGTPASTSRSLRERLLKATPDTVVGFGQLQSAPQFLRNQVELRIQKRAQR